MTLQGLTRVLEGDQVHRRRGGRGARGRGGQADLRVVISFDTGTFE